MTHNVRFAFAVSTSMRSGVAIAGAILSAAIISGGAAAATETRGQAPSTATEMQQFIYSPWAKFCDRGSLGGREVCFTGRDARTEAGQLIVAVTLIEPEGKPEVFRVALSSRPAQPRSAHIIIDMEPAVSSAVACSFDTCMADYEATAKLVDKLKKGRMLQSQAVNLAVPMIPFSLPLADNGGNSFAGANEGPWDARSTPVIGRVRAGSMGYNRTGAPQHVGAEDVAERAEAYRQQEATRG